MSDRDCKACKGYALCDLVCETPDTCASYIPKKMAEVERRLLSYPEFRAVLELHKQWLLNPGDLYGKCADFSNCILRGMRFRYEDLRFADFTNADLQGADFTNANLQGANFTDAILDNANFIGATLDGAIPLRGYDEEQRKLDKALMMLANYSNYLQFQLVEDCKMATANAVPFDAEEYVTLLIEDFEYHRLGGI